jgi:hypothetical protein
MKQIQKQEFNDVIALRGGIELQLRNARNGQIVERRLLNNVVVTAGRRFVLQQIASSELVTSHSFSHIAVGTDTTAAATSDTALGSETTRIAIGTFTTSNLTSNPPSWRAEVSLATNEGNTTLGEVGILNSSSGGTMLAHAVFTTINKTTSNTLNISYTISN